MGIFYANTLHNQTPEAWQSGITFTAKKILRFAIVIYGFRITFQQIAAVGLDGFLVSLIMLSTTLILGSWIGYKIFKMEKDTSILTASGQRCYRFPPHGSKNLWYLCRRDDP